jgi:hypothetical protein
MLLVQRALCQCCVMSTHVRSLCTYSCIQIYLCMVVQDLREHRQQLSMSPVRSSSPTCVHPKQASATTHLEHSDSVLLQQLRAKAAQYARKACACIILSSYVCVYVCVCAAVALWGAQYLQRVGMQVYLRIHRYTHNGTYAHT